MNGKILYAVDMNLISTRYSKRIKSIEFFELDYINYQIFFLDFVKEICYDLVV